MIYKQPARAQNPNPHEKLWPELAENPNPHEKP